MSEGIKRVYVAATAVTDDENGDGHSEGSSVEQQAVLSDYAICKDSSVAEIEIPTFFFRKIMSQKTTQ